MIGVKSIAVVVIAGGAVAAGIAGGALSLAHFEELTLASAFAIGLFASLAGALVGFAARPGVRSRAAVVVRGGRPGLAVDLPAAHPEVRELPPLVQRALLVGAFACLGLVTFTSDATARIASVPADLAAPSRAEYCLPEPAEPAAAPAPVAPPPPPVDQAGCALVKRAFALGYAKSLGSCAPRAAPVAPAPAAKPAAREVCDRRQLDEPFLHYTWRRVLGTVRGASPIDAARTRIHDVRTRVAYLDDLVADIRHSVTGTPHGSHHLWITLPDPHPRSALHVFTGEEPCASTFADLPLWPAWSATSPPGAIVEHVLGQLLFATRFGTPASCSDYTIHWDAPRDACARLAADPAGFLAAHDALAPIRAVLDRRRRQAALRRLALDLGQEPTLPEPPPASSVVSVACLVVAPNTAPAFGGRALALDGEAVLLREASVGAVEGTAAGPLELYTQLARLLAGVAPLDAPAAALPAAGAAPPAMPAAGTPGDPPRALEPLEPLDAPDFPLARLEPLVAHDPFVDREVRALLARPEVVEVYPFDRHLHAFVEAFRRAYFAQRGRL